MPSQARQRVQADHIAVHSIGARRRGAVRTMIAKKARRLLSATAPRASHLLSFGSPVVCCYDVLVLLAFLSRCSSVWLSVRSLHNRAKAATRQPFGLSVPGLKITLLSQLPKAPAAVQAACGALAKPTSEGGKLAASLGWGVVGEQKLGPYDAVSFAAEFAPAASAACVIDKGNVALFRGAQLVALIYAPPKVETPIGDISLVGDRLPDLRWRSGPRTGWRYPVDARWRRSRLILSRSRKVSAAVRAWCQTCMARASTRFARP